MRKITILLSILVLSLQACYNDNEEELYPQLKNGGGCDTANTTYTAVISKIVNNSCALAGCHKGVGAAPGNFENHAGIKQYLDNNKQRFIDAIEQNGNAPLMPKGSPKLPSCDIEQIKAWIAKGYRNN